MSTPGVVVLELVERHRRKAEEIEPYSPDTARTMRALIEEYEAAVRRSLPEWWTLSAVRAAKPWGPKYLRQKCQELEGLGMARKGSSGHWLMRWDAVLELRDPPSRPEEIDTDQDLDALAEELARSA